VRHKRRSWQVHLALASLSSALRNSDSELALSKVHRDRCLHPPTRPQGAHRELTIEEVVADPIVCDLMQADHVDPDALETLLRWVAAHAPEAACK
jgi:hypothetical protein